MEQDEEARKKDGERERNIETQEGRKKREAEEEELEVREEMKLSASPNPPKIVSGITQPMLRATGCCVNRAHKGINQPHKTRVRGSLQLYIHLVREEGGRGRERMGEGERECTGIIRLTITHSQRYSNTEKRTAKRRSLATHERKVRGERRAVQNTTANVI